MASNRGFRRLGLWWCLGFCLLCSPVVDATTRIPIEMKTAREGVTGVPSRSAGSLVITSPTKYGQYIRYEPGGRKMHIPVSGRQHYSLYGMTLNAKNMFQRSLPAVVMGGAIAGIGYGLEWMFDNSDLQWKKPGELHPIEFDPNSYYWQSISPVHAASDPLTVCSMMESDFTGQGYNVYETTFTVNSTGRSANCRMKFYDAAGVPGSTSGLISRQGASCPDDATYDPERHACVMPAEFVPLTQTDFDALDSLDLSDFDDAYLQDILNSACNGSNAPDLCFEELLEKSDLIGPASVTSPTTTSTTISTGPDGISTQKNTETSTRINITYGDNYYDYSTTRSSTTTHADGSTETVTETDDDPASEPEEQPQDEPVAVPCSENCDGPEYQDLYTPSEEVKETVLDSYAERAGSIPLIQAVTGFFDVSVSASCPNWSTQVQFELLGFGFDYPLFFDWHCQPWFTDYRPYAMAVFLVIAAFLAFRIGML